MARAKGDATSVVISGQYIDRCSKFEYFMPYNSDPVIVCHNEVLYINTVDTSVLSKVGDYRIVKSWEDILNDDERAVFKNRIPDAIDRWSQETSGTRSF